MNTVLVIDVYNVARACFHVVPPLTAPDGRPVNAVKGFVSCVTAAIEQFTPDELILAFEGTQNWRYDVYPQYKEDRGGQPPDFKVQVEIIRELATAAGWACVIPATGEADDVLASVVASRSGDRVLLYTSDKDAKGLISENVSTLVRRNDGSGLLTCITPADVKEKYGITCEQFRDYLALMGDSSDSIPGVDGIGAKTASNLLAKFGTAAAIFERVGEVSAATAKKLVAGKANYEIALRLVALDNTLPIPDEAPLGGTGRLPALISLLGRLGFSMSARRMLARRPAAPVPAPAFQAELF